MLSSLLSATNALRAEAREIRAPVLSVVQSSRQSLHSTGEGRGEEGSPHLPTAHIQNLASAQAAGSRMRSTGVLFLRGRKPSDWQLWGGDSCVPGCVSLEWSFCLTELGRGKRDQALSKYHRINKNYPILADFLE